MVEAIEVGILSQQTLSTNFRLADLFFYRPGANGNNAAQSARPHGPDNLPWRALIAEDWYP